MAEHFARVECRESGGRPRVFAKRLSSFDPSDLEIDEDAVDFPMSEVIGRPYDALGYAWEELGDGQGWRECLRIFQSVSCTADVALTEGHLLAPGHTTLAVDPDAEAPSASSRRGP